MRKILVVTIGTVLLTACSPYSRPQQVSSTMTLTSPSSSASSAMSSANSLSSSTIEDINEQTPEDHQSLEVGPKAVVDVAGHITPRETISFGQGKAVLTEYMDYDCEFCRQHALDERAWIDELYVATGKLTIERIYVPMNDLGKTLAQAALCAAHQDKFTAMDQFLLTETPKSDEPIYKRLKKLGLKDKEFRTCMKKDTVSANAEAANAAGVTRVPSFVIGKQSWRGILSERELRKIIEAQV